MKKINLLLTLFAMAVMLTSCGDDDDVTPVEPNAGTISGGPFEIVVDGTPDMVSGISLDDSDAVGANSTWVITDDAGNILGLPPTLDAVEDVDFDAAGVGICFIWYMRYEDGLTGLEVGANTSGLDGSFALSNSIQVTRADVTLIGAVLTGGPFTIVVDGTADMVSGITIDESNATGSNSSFVITDDAGTILGLPPTLDAVEGVDFDGAGVGVCFIWNIRYEDGLTGLEADANVSDLSGTFVLSNSIEVNRIAPLNAGTLSGGPFTITVDGTPDMISGVALDAANSTGTNSGFVITDDMGNILGLPPTLEAVEGVDFDGAGVGVCFVWHITYEDGLTGLEMGMNTDDLDGIFALSNSVEVNRIAPLNAGTLSGGPFTITVDGTPDMISGITLDDTNSSGTNTGFVITDDMGNILGLPPTLEAVEGVDFDGAGVGVCLVWHITYEDGLTGLEMGMNTADLDGLFALSNSVTVNRVGLNAGTLAGGPFTITVDGTPDMISGITLDDTNNTGTNSGFVITDDMGNILGLPPTLEAVEGVDFDGAGVGVCLVWHITYEDGLTGLEMGMNTADLDGFFGLSNSITVNRIGLNAGTLSGGPFTITVDGTPDMVSGILLDDTDVTGTNSTYVITDDMGNILGLPPTLEAVEGVDFDGAGVGVCFIWHLTYEDGIVGLEMGMNTDNLEGFFGLSNSITVTRQ